MNYFPFHVGDYAAHTRHLSLMEDLAYRRLLDAYYLRERPLNGSATDVARLIGMREHAEEVDFVLRTFFVQSADGFRNRRADQEIAAFATKKQQQSSAGRASAERRSIARSTNAERTINGGSTTDQPTRTKNQEPRTNNQEPKKFDAVASGAAGVPEPTRTELWSAGKSLLAEQGMKSSQCGSFIGKLVKDYGDDAVLDAVRSAVVARPADAATFLVGACKARGRPASRSRQQQAEDLALQSEREWLAQHGVTQ